MVVLNAVHVQCNQQEQFPNYVKQTNGVPGIQTREHRVKTWGYTLKFECQINYFLFKK